MKTYSEKILRSTFFAWIGFSFLSIWYKIMHKPVSEYLLLASLILGAIFIITAILEVSRSTKISRNEKTMWIIGFLFLTVIAGLLYMLTGRKRVS